MLVYIILLGAIAGITYLLQTQAYHDSRNEVTRKKNHVRTGYGLRMNSGASAKVVEV